MCIHECLCVYEPNVKNAHGYNLRTRPRINLKSMNYQNFMQKFIIAFFVPHFYFIQNV